MYKYYLAVIFILVILCSAVDQSFAHAPTAVIADCPKYVVVDDLVQFDGSGSYDDDGYITEYDWDFPADANGLYGETTAEPNCVFNAAGIYWIRLKVKDNWGYWSSYVYCSIFAASDPNRVHNTTRDIWYSHIQLAIGDANEMDELEVQQGRCYEFVDFGGKDMILRSCDPNDWAVVSATIIDAKDMNPAVTFYGTEGSACILSGLTITNGYGPTDDAGGGIWGASGGSGTSATVSNCIIRDNVAEKHGGAIRDFNGLVDRCRIFGNSTVNNNGGGLCGCNGVIRNCLIYNNTATLNGGGMVLCNGDIVNCTVADNTAGVSGAGIAWCGNATITNCIIWGNNLEQVAGGAPTYSCIQDWTGGGTGNISTDPYFDTFDSAYHLLTCSPCVDAGDPNSDYSNEPFSSNPDINCAVNMGAYGNTLEAALSIADLPYSTSFEYYQGFASYEPYEGDDPNELEELNDWYISGLDGFEDPNVKVLGGAYWTFVSGNPTSYSYQYVGVGRKTVLSRDVVDTGQEHDRIRVNCIPSPGLRISLMNDANRVASVSFGEEELEDTIYVLDDGIYTDTTISYKTIAAQCRQYLQNTDPNMEYTYEDTWVELEFRVDWPNNKYDVYWSHWNDTGSCIKNDADFDNEYSYFTELRFEQLADPNLNLSDPNIPVFDANECALINRVSITDQTNYGGVFGQDVYLTYPEGKVDAPIRGQQELIGSVWFDCLGAYIIKCYPSDIDPCLINEVAKEFEGEEIDPCNIWSHVYTGYNSAKDSFIGTWDTSVLMSGDYFLKIEVYDDIGRLYSQGTITKELEYNNKTKEVNVRYPVAGRLKGDTFHHREKPDITVNWPGQFPFELVRIYNNNMRQYPVPFWYGWTHNHNIRIIENSETEWTKDSYELPEADSVGLGIGRLWLQEGASCRIFIGYVNPDNSAQVIYEPTDSQVDYIVRTSSIDDSDPCAMTFDVSYTHYATDGIETDFSSKDNEIDSAVYSSIPENEGVVGWSAMSVINEKRDRFGNALRYTWESNGIYLSSIKNNCTEARIEFSREDGGQTLPIYTKAILKYDPEVPDEGEAMYVDYMIQSYSGLGNWEWVYYVERKEPTGAAHLSGLHVRGYYYITDPENPDGFMLNIRTSIGVFVPSSTGILPCMYLEYDTNGLLKRREDPIDAPDESPVRYYYLNLVDEKQYSNSYDSEGNLVTVTKYFVRDDGSDTVHYKIVTTTRNSFGAVLSQKTQTRETKEYDKFDYYNGFPSYSDPNGGNYIGGGGYTDYSYLYEDSRFPLLPTTIYEDFDDDGDGDYDRDTRITTRAYDSRGNLTEQKVFVDGTDYVATLWEYHPIYNFPTKKTTWQGYCTDDGYGGIDPSGAKVETQWIYGDEGGTSDPCGIYLIEQKVLLDEATNDWALTNYTYYEVTDVGAEPNEYGLIKTKTDPEGNNPEGNITYYEYDDNGFVSKVWEGATLVSGYPKDNPQKRYYFDGLGRKALEANALGKVSMNLFDGFDNAYEVRRYTDTTALGRSDFEPATYDDPDTYEDDEAYDSKKEYGYNSINRLKYEKLPTGGSILYTYKMEDGEQPRKKIYSDKSSWFCSNTKYGRPEYVDTYPGTERRVIEYLYDSSDRVRDTYWRKYNYPTHPVVKHQQVSYYGSGNKKTEIVYRVENVGGVYVGYQEKIVNYYYDELDRLIEQVINANSEFEPFAEPVIVDYGYDAIGNRIYVIDPNGSVIFTDYDNANRKTKEYFAQPPVYDPCGLIDIDATKANATVKKEVQYYDDNKVKKVTSYDYDGATILSQSDFDYDSRGRIEKVTQWISDANDAVTSYAYADCNDFVPADFEYDINDDPNFYMFNIIITDAEGKVTKIGLTPDGHRNSTKYPSGDYELIHFYGHGLPASKLVFNGGNDPCWTEYEYDAFGKLAKKIFPDGNIEYGYGPRSLGEYGLLESVTDNRNTDDRVADEPDNTFTFEYDIFDRISSYTDYEDYTIYYKYRAADNQKTSIDVNDPDNNRIYGVDYSYDKAGRLIGLTDSGGITQVANFGYSPNGARTMLKYYPGGDPCSPLATISYDYNADNFLKSFTTAGATFSFDASDANSIDGLGRLVSANETLIDPNGDAVTHSLSYSYDGLGQLLSASMTNINNSYTWSADYSYSRDGNIKSKTVNSETTNFGYDYGDLMTDIGSDTLTWDDNGQLTESVTASLEYNWSGKLRKAKVGQSDVIKAIKYDPFGNRVYKEVPGSPDVKRRYIVDMAGRLPVILLIMDAGNDNSVVRSYVYAGAQPIAFYEGDYTDPNYFYLHDRLGSVRQVLDSAGNVKNTYTYTPFGRDPNSQFAEAVDNPFRFTGQWYDTEIGQYYLRARQYEPELMRFCAIDPVKQDGADNSLLSHVYLYCTNDPVNWIDRTGLAPEIVTYAMLTAEMEDVYEDIKDQSRWNPLWLAGTFADTKWKDFPSQEYYVYPLENIDYSIKTTGECLNYVGVGMGFKHVGFGLPTATALVVLWNLPGEDGYFDIDVPKIGEIGWAYYGYFRYNEISGEGLSYAEELFASAVLNEFGLDW